MNPRRSLLSAPLTVASAIAARTQRLKIGTAVQILPLGHPLRLAEETATIDQISGGRLIFGVGRSAFPRAYDAYGISYEESEERFAESLDIIKKAWTETAVSHHGRYFSFENFTLVPRPVQQPHPPIRIAASRPDTYVAIGKHGKEPHPMPLSIRALQPLFAGEVTGVDCRRPLDRDTVAAVEQAMDEYAVLVFPEQELSDSEQIAFTRHFGELERYDTPGHIRKREDSRLGPGIADFSNLDKSGSIMSAEERVWFFKLADRLWHSDSSFRPVPAKYSLLSGRVIPTWGANTEFADMRAAYDALDERTKAEVEDLVCDHSLIYSREAIGLTEWTPQEAEGFRPVCQPLVRTHPVTGRRSLFLAAHAGAILGWTIPEARMFLRDLTEHATRPEFVYSHAWRPHDLVMWDNRTTMHRARRFDHREVRDVRRTTLAGDAPLIPQPADLPAARALLDSIGNEDPPRPGDQLG